MKLKLTTAQQQEINGNWLLFEGCPIPDKITTLEGLTREQLDWLGTQASDYQGLAESNEETYRGEGESEKAFTWRAFGRSMKALEAKIDYAINGIEPASKYSYTL